MLMTVANIRDNVNYQIFGVDQKVWVSFFGVLIISLKILRMFKSIAFVAVNAIKISVRVIDAGLIYGIWTSKHSIEGVFFRLSFYIMSGLVEKQNNKQYSLLHQLLRASHSQQALNGNI